MEELKGYDEWKTSPPEEGNPVTYCDYCNKGLFEGDRVYRIQNENICEECMEKYFSQLL